MGIKNSLRRVISVIGKEFKHVWFDSSFFFLTVLSPAVLLMLLSYIFSFDVDKAQLAVINQDQSPQSFEYIRMLTSDGNVRVSATVQNYDQALELFRASRIDAALTIPPNFSSNLKMGRPSPVNLVVDGSDAGTAFQIINSIQQRTTIYSSSLSTAGALPFDVRIRVWFNPNLDSQHSMVPGLMSLVLILPAMAVALGVTREKETGTFETLVTTPIKGYEYLIGKLVVYLGLGLVGALLALGVAVYWFRVPFRGELGLFMLLTADYLFAIMGFGMLVAHFVPSQRAVTSVILLTLFIPSFFMTGLLLPIDQGSIFSKYISLGMPATHYIVISRGISLKALPLDALYSEALALLLMGFLAITASITLFSKKIH